MVHHPLLLLLKLWKSFITSTAKKKPFILIFQKTVWSFNLFSINTKIWLFTVVQSQVVLSSTVIKKHTHFRQFNDNFLKTPTYNDNMFRRRYCKSQSLFLHIIDAVESYDNYFRQRRDTMGRPGLSSLPKITAGFRMLAYGVLVNTT